MFVGDPVFAVPKSAATGRPRSRAKLTTRSPRPQSLEQLAKSMPESSWHRITWRKGAKGPLVAEFVILRATPAHRWHSGQMHEQIWLICERTVGKESVRKFYFSNLPASISRKQLVAITHERWAIEQHYRDLKQETALDHFEGRSCPGCIATWR